MPNTKHRPPVHNPFKRNVRIPGGGSVKILFASAFDGKVDHQLSYSDVQKLAKGPLAAIQPLLDAELATVIVERTVQSPSTA